MRSSPAGRVGEQRAAKRPLPPTTPSQPITPIPMGAASSWPPVPPAPSPHRTIVYARPSSLGMGDSVSACVGGGGGAWRVRSGLLGPSAARAQGGRRTEHQGAVLYAGPRLRILPPAAHVHRAAPPPPPHPHGTSPCRWKSRLRGKETGANKEKLLRAAAARVAVEPCWEIQAIRKNDGWRGEEGKGVGGVDLSMLQRRTASGVAPLSSRARSRCPTKPASRPETAPLHAGACPPSPPPPYAPTAAAVSALAGGHPWLPVAGELLGACVEAAGQSWRRSCVADLRRWAGEKTASRLWSAVAAEAAVGRAADPGVRRGGLGCLRRLSRTVSTPWRRSAQIELSGLIDADFKV